MTRSKQILVGMGVGVSLFLFWYLVINAEDYATARKEYIDRLPNDKVKLTKKIIADSGYTYSEANSLAVQNAYPSIDAMKARLADLNIPKYLRHYL